MGHVGLTPQTATALGGYRSQGRTAERALDVMHDALALQDAGCFALVFEAIPSALTEATMPRMEIPVIGIGAGAATDGQVLVFHDLLGIYDGHAARFVKRYADVRDEMIRGVTAFADEVRARRYPSPSTATRWPPTRSRGSTSCSGADRRAVHGRVLALTVHGGELRLSTEGNGDTIDITAGVQSVVDQSGVDGGLASVSPCRARPPRSPRWSTSRAACRISARRSSA